MSRPFEVGRATARLRVEDNQYGIRRFSVRSSCCCGERGSWEMPVDDYTPSEYTRHCVRRSAAKAKSRNRVPSGPSVEFAFARVLREIRQGQNLSQEDLAGQTGFDRTFVSMLERGLASPSLRSLFRLAEALRVTPSQIIRRMEQSTPNRPVRRI
jgi:ribosome-binding protein aMBF1 (putative translation factor)